MAKSKSGGGGKNVHVGPHPNGGWQAKKEGGARAIAVTPTKKEAEKIGREVAKKEGSELVIRGENGRIQDKDSHGNDPKKTKG